MKNNHAVNPVQLSRNRKDKLLFFSSWLLSTILIGKVTLPPQDEHIRIVRYSFTGHPYSDGIVVAVVLGLVVALTVLGIKRLSSDPHSRQRKNS